MPIDETRIKKLQDLLKLVSEGLTKEEFGKAFKAILAMILKIEKKNDDKFVAQLEDLKKQITDAIDKEDFQKQISDALSKIDIKNSDLRNQLLGAVNKALKEQENGLNFIRDKVRKIKEGIDGKNGVDGLPGKDGKDGKDGSPDSPIEIRDKLETLEDDDRLDISAIKDLKKELEEIKKINTTRQIFGGGFSKIAMDQHIIPWTEATGTPNDVLTDFVIGYSPNPINSLEVMVGGSPLFLTDDYTYAIPTRTISFLVAPPTGSKVRYKCLV
jgi:hypothetical protein